MTASEEIGALADKIEGYFKENAFPVSNEPVLRRIRFMCGQIGGLDRDVAEKAGDIANLASIFFSARKHREYPGGAEEICNRIIYELLPRIRTLAKRLER